jgi:alkylation response protein AidB-like acyl-CoA dehydrogenase
MIYGTEEQRARYMPPIARAEEHWCTLYSEPEAGSDLASLRTRAVADGDDFIINGQKIWNGRAHLADFGWLAARTDPTAPKHRGITLFMVDMKAPGVSVRPLIDMADRHHFNEVFFDNVRIPRANIVGELNRGWYYIATALDFERSGIQNFAMGRRTVHDMVARLRQDPRIAAARPAIRHEVAERAIEVEVGTNLAYLVALMQARGDVPNKEASASRVFGTELTQRVTLTGMHLAGLEGQLRGGCQQWIQLYLLGMAETIAGGTAEIQRQIIATRGLGMPRG